MAEGTVHIARRNDCISKLADEHGLFWETVWNHPENAALKEKRKDPNVLAEGDRVFIPDRAAKVEESSTDTRQRFRKKGVPAVARFRFLSEGRPRADKSFCLVIDGRIEAGSTDADGIVEVKIPPGAREGAITITDDEHEETYLLALGGMDPVTEISGARMRLANLGYDCGDPDEDRLEEALRDFQLHQSLENTGRLDEETQKALLAAHGC